MGGRVRSHGLLPLIGRHGLPAKRPPAAVSERGPFGVDGLSSGGAVSDSPWWLDGIKIAPSPTKRTDPSSLSGPGWMPASAGRTLPRQARCYVGDALLSVAQKSQVLRLEPEAQAEECRLSLRERMLPLTGIGGASRLLPSHTTGHTGPYHGGSIEFSGRRCDCRSPGFGCLASPRVIRSLHDQHPRFHPDPPSSRPVATGFSAAFHP